MLMTLEHVSRDGNLCTALVSPDTEFAIESLRRGSTRNRYVCTSGHSIYTDNGAVAQSERTIAVRVHDPVAWAEQEQAKLLRVRACWWCRKTLPEDLPRHARYHKDCAKVLNYERASRAEKRSERWRPHYELTYKGPSRRFNDVDDSDDDA